MSDSIKDDIEELNAISAFQWVDHEGVRHDPQQMNTHHLFYTLRMIWNHSAPSQLKIRPYKKYTHFKKMYTNAYMKLAVKAIILELAQRPWEEKKHYTEQLDYMYRIINTGSYVIYE